MRRRDVISLMGAAAAAAPAIVRAQVVRKMPTVGYLWHAGSAKEETPYYEALIEGFSRLGYADGRNISLLHRFPNEIPDRFRSMAAELVSLNLDVLMGGSLGPEGGTRPVALFRCCQGALIGFGNERPERNRRAERNCLQEWEDCLGGTLLRQPTVSAVDRDLRVPRLQLAQPLQMPVGGEPVLGGLGQNCLLAVPVRIGQGHSL